jgi:hypothetical protein
LWILDLSLGKSIICIERNSKMATYECSKCGMAVNATCAKCDAPLVNDILKLDDGQEVQISKCPNGHGKIKSPMCCGEDMSCSIS